MCRRRRLQRRGTGCVRRARVEGAPGAGDAAGVRNRRCVTRSITRWRCSRWPGPGRAGGTAPSAAAGVLFIAGIVLFCGSHLPARADRAGGSGPDSARWPGVSRRLAVSGLGRASWRKESRLRNGRLRDAVGTVPTMMFYDYYADVPEDELRAFVTSQQLGRLVTVDARRPAAHRAVSLPVPRRPHRDAPASQRRAARGSRGQRQMRVRGRRGAGLDTLALGARRPTPCSPPPITAP